MAKNNKSWKAGLIDTPCGKMTRYQASVLSGVAYGTIIRRVWEKRPVELLFLPELGIRRGKDARPRKRWRRLFTEKSLTEKWADRKKRKAISANRP